MTRESSRPPEELVAAVAQVGWDALLPEHRADGDRPVGTPRCVSALLLTERIAVTVVVDDAERTYVVPLVTGPGPVRRARPGDGAAEALVELLGAGSRRVGDLETSTWHHRQATGERGISVDQTNESVIVGDAAVVKWTHLAEEGPHPAPSLLAELDAAGFTGMPRPWGSVVWWPPSGGRERLVALVTAYVPEAVDGWTWVVDDLRAAATAGDLAKAHLRGELIGSLVAAFHRALAATARPSTAAEAESWRSGALADLDRALALSTGQARDVLTTHEEQVRAVLAAPVAPGTPVMRVHGDLHIGQVLRGMDGDLPAHVLTDFDGNPVVPAEERTLEQPAAIDVAAMTQSLVHAGLVIHRHHPEIPADEVLAAAGAARRGFLDAYLDELGEASHLYDPALLTRFALRQVCLEFVYAATHLPRWSYVPEAALPLLLRGDLP